MANLSVVAHHCSKVRCTGIEVDHVTIYRRVQRFTPLLIDSARPCRHAAGDRWFADETDVKVAGRRWVYLYRSINQYGQVMDVLVSEQRACGIEHVLPSLTQQIPTTASSPASSTPCPPAKVSTCCAPPVRAAQANAIAERWIATARRELRWTRH
ncbi:MAG: IS6 family transposase [Pseudonocardiales bacterium]|nr:IS6 family transposase [Pseudonocardiales bacterium]